ncbi:MAG TPA: efflux RND transporter periplasmic adaptor subunit [Candidatus Acidoferrum sp.]|nr:efflux RND transporter periplasmic adaptor subunit [Candidatus Acidoferrum sp.]
MPVDRLAVVCLAAMGVAGCGAKSASVSASGEGGPGAAIPVQVQLVESKPIAETTEYLALLKSRHSATINPQVEGYITKIFARSGEHVLAGAALLQIDPLKQEATVNSQEATRLAQESNVNLARVNLERAKKLAEAGVIAKSDLDNAETNYDTAVAQLKSLEHQVEQQKVQLRYYKVSSPMDGIVGDIPVRVGDRVIVSTLLTTVDEPGALEAYLYIPAARGKELKLGLPVKLLDEAGNMRSESQITFISPQVDSDTQTILAKAAVPNPKANLRIAQQVRAQVVWGNASGAVAPVLAVTRINGQFFVFVAEKEAKGTAARQRGVKVGEIIGNDYAILDGLKPGEHLIVSGTQFLQDGAPVSEQIQTPGPKPEHTPKTGK